MYFSSFLALGALVQAAAATYFAPNSTGLRIQHGFETILIQPFGYDGFRVRAWPFRPPSGNEISFIYDPPIEGYEDTAHGMSYDTATTGTEPRTLRNGNIINPQTEEDHLMRRLNEQIAHHECLTGTLINIGDGMLVAVINTA